MFALPWEIEDDKLKSDYKDDKLSLKIPKAQWAQRKSTNNRCVIMSESMPTI